MSNRDAPPHGMVISRPSKPLDGEVMGRLCAELEQCPDVAFAHLPEVRVPERQDEPGLVLFVWLEAAAMRSLRQALNAVSDRVASVIERDTYLDVVILNSAPELLGAVEEAGCLVVERDPEERRRALDASRQPEPEAPPRRPWWRF